MAEVMTFLTQNVRHAVSGDENCLMRTAQAGLRSHFFA